MNARKQGKEVKKMAFSRPTQMRVRGAGVNFKAVSVSDRIALKATQSYNAVAVKDVKLEKVNKK